MVKQAEKLEIQDPILPRKRKVPCRYEIGSTTTTASIITPEDHYRIIYFEAFDIVIAQITDRFEQEGYQMYSKLENFLIGKQDDDLDELIEFYGNDFENDALLAQLDSFHANYAIDENATVHDIIPVIQRASEASETDYQSCSIEISDIYVYVCIHTSKMFARASNYVS